MELTSDGRTKQISAHLCVLLHLRHGVDWAPCSRLGVKLPDAQSLTHTPQDVPEELAMGLSARVSQPSGATQGKALESSSSAIRGEEENWSWVGGLLGGRLNSIQPGLEPGLPN